MVLIDGGLEMMRVIIRWAIAGLFFAGFVCRADDGSPHVTQNVRSAVAAVDGVYRWRNDLKRYVYSEKRALAAILDRTDAQAAVLELVDCLDDVLPSHSRLDDKPVMIGVICHESLTQLVYYEPAAKELGASRQWAGDISPKASPQQLLAAKKAWKAVVKAGKHILL